MQITTEKMKTDLTDANGEDPWNKQHPLNTIPANELNSLPI